MHIAILRFGGFNRLDRREWFDPLFAAGPGVVRFRAVRALAQRTSVAAARAAPER